MLGVVALALPAALVRLAQFSGTSASVLVVGAAPVLLWVGWPVLVVAVLRRRAVLVAGAAAVAAVHLLAVVQAGAPAIASRPAAGPELRVMVHNVFVLNEDVDALAAQVREQDPDLLVLVELTGETSDALAERGAYDGLPYGLDTTDRGEGVLLRSRHPLTRQDVLVLGDRRMPTAVLRAPGAADVRLVGVHVAAPLGSRLPLWHEGLEGLADVARDADGPVVLAGDFNADTAHRPFADLLGTGLVDAHDAVDRRWARTWPAWPLPRLLLLDHVLVGEDVEVRSVDEGEAAGSDHLAVVADLRLPAAG